MSHRACSHRTYGALREASWHPTDEQLVSLIDAELSDRDADQVRGHLTRCWQCKARHRQLDDTIAAFMTAYADDEESSREVPPVLLAPALRVLRQPSASTASVRIADAWRRGTRAVLATVTVSRATAVRLCAVGATALLVVLLTSNVQLSARQLVQRIDRVERNVLGATQTPVVYQRLEVSQRRLPAQQATRGTWDVWTDVGSRRQRSRSSSARVSNEPMDALFTVLDRHDMRDGWPVSIRVHQQWRTNEAAAAQDRVVSGLGANGVPTITLESTNAPDNGFGIVRAALVVREADWHPIEQQLVVRDADGLSEFVVREMEFDVVSRVSLPVAFFDEPARERPEAEVIAAAPRVDVPRLPAAVDLVTAEVQAMFALHSFGLTAEDDITVTRGPRTVDVNGLTSTDDRRRRLVSAIEAIPLVRAHIRTAEEAVAAANTAPSMRFDDARIEASKVPAQTIATGDRPGERPDDRADPAAMRRARDAVRQSLALLERAWALRRLAEWSRRTNASDVTASARELIERMARAHADEASRALDALDTTVAPVLRLDTAADAEAAAAAAAAPPRAWADVAIDFFGIAAEIDRDTRRLFTASTSPTTTAADEARRLRRRLDDAARWLDALHQARP